MLGHNRTRNGAISITLQSRYDNSFYAVNKWVYVKKLDMYIIIY